MQIQFEAKEATIKLVYYGPALSGKTTNLRSLHDMTKPESRGRLMTLETRDDRTLFFDVLPFIFRPEDGEGRPSMPNNITLRVKIYTVPGQVIHGSTRKLLLQGADGVVFVADAQRNQAQANTDSFLNLRDNLNELGIAIKDIPLVIQFNKRDLDDSRSPQDIEDLAARGREPVYWASAIAGDGVLESFFALLHLTWLRLDRSHNLSEMLGIESHRFIELTARQLGVEMNFDTLCERAVSGSLERRSML